jgi:hypothetical protein
VEGEFYGGKEEEEEDEVGPRERNRAEGGFE